MAKDERATATACKPTTIGRKTKFSFSKGKQVYLLDDTGGKTWVMKSMGMIVDTTPEFDQLDKLAKRSRLL